MTFLIIPVDNTVPSFTVTLNIEGIFFKFNFDYNYRDARWHLSIYNTDNTPVLLGLKLVLNYELIFQHPIEGLPRGSLMLYDLSSTNDPCVFDDKSLGDRCQLIYITSDEIANGTF